MHRFLFLWPDHNAIVIDAIDEDDAVVQLSTRPKPWLSAASDDPVDYWEDIHDGNIVMMVEADGWFTELIGE